MFGLCWLATALMSPALAQVVIHGIANTPESPLLRDQSVHFNADASASAGGALEYRWDFGDGTPRTEWLSAADISHAYGQAGVYTLLLQVRHPTLGLASATKVLVVRLAPAAAAISSSQLLLHQARRELWVVNPDHASVSVIDVDSSSLLDEIPVGDDPTALALDNAGQVWVSVQGIDLLARIDPVSRTVVDTMELDYGARPVALLFDGAGWGYVALAGSGRVQRFVAATGQPDGALELVEHVHALTLSGDQSALYVSGLISRGEQGSVWRIDLPGFATAVPIALPLDTTSPDSGTAARGLPNYIGALALAEDGSSLWYGGKKDNILRGLFREGQPLNFESVLRSLIGRVDTAAASETVTARMDIDDAGRVSALLLPPGSSHLFAALETNNKVVVLDPWNRRELAELEGGRAPRALAFDAQTGRLFVHDFLSRQLSVYSVAEMLVDGSSPALALGAIATTSFEPLDPEILLGKRIFYNAMDVRMGQDSYTSCGACHLDGRGDGRVWDFTQLGEGLRNTTSLLGSAGMGRGLVHWSGNFDEIQDFEGPIRNLFGGIGFMDDTDFFADGRDHPLGPTKAGFSADLDALAAYVASLDIDDRSPYRNPDGTLSADGQAGRLLFGQLNCQRCHAGPAYTDSDAGLRHDVGTLSAASGQRLGGPLLALDTPSLRGLFGSAPYLHDGSAATLEDVLLTRNPMGAHGDTAALSAGQRDQLIAFLLQIDANEAGLGTAAQLQITTPTAGTSILAGQNLTLAIVTNLPQIQRVDYLIDGQIVATAMTPPWNADWSTTGSGPRTLNVQVIHDAGAFHSLSADRVVTVLGDELFGDGFE